MTDTYPEACQAQLHHVLILKLFKIDAKRAQHGRPCDVDHGPRSLPISGGEKGGALGLLPVRW